MGLISKIETLANDIAKDYSNLRLIPRGSPTFIDQNLRGTIRFAKRSGNFLPVISPDNSSSLAADIEPPTNKLVLSRVSSAFEILDAVLTIGPGRELIRVADIDTDTGEVVTQQELRGTHAAGTEVDLYGVPIQVIGPQAAGDTTIQVRSQFHMMIGDKIAVDTTKGLLSSTVQTLVTNATFLGETIDGRFNYELDIHNPLSRNLEGDEYVLARGQPAYQSQPQSVSRVGGPFVLDYISGPFFDQTVIDEYLNVQLLSATGSPIDGYGAPVSVTKNSPIVNVPIKSESMLFWDVIYGSVQLRDERFVAITDHNGHFCLSQPLVPAFPPNVEWQIPVRSNTSALLRIKFEPNEYRDYRLTKSTLTQVIGGVGLGDQSANRIEIVVQSSKPYAEIEFNNWVTTTSAVSSIVYQVTSNAYGNNVWQAGSLMLKPYFYTLDDIRARYDFTGYNRGVVHL